MKRKTIILIGSLIFLVAGISAYVSAKILNRCSVQFSYHEYDGMDKKRVCDCILPELHSDFKFTLTVDRVSNDKKWLRFTLSSPGLDNILGFMKIDQAGRWQLVDYGSYIEDEDMDKYAIPQDIRPDFIQTY